MGDILFVWAIIAYSGAAVLITYNHLRGHHHPSIPGWWLVASGWLAHCTASVQTFLSQHNLSVNFTAALSLSALAMGLLYLISWRIQRQTTRSVGLLLLPFMVISLGAALLLPTTEPKIHTLTNPVLIFHLALSLLAYGLLSIAAILALLDAFQEHALKTKRFGKLFNMLPPLYALEETLFLMVNMGFILLSLSIMTGSVYSFLQYDQLFIFGHKVLFTWATWLLFGTLLLGHRLWGWRGKKASQFTILGYLFLALAFLGVKFVTDIIL
ncbi:MAG: cytochrome c biogenesis protein CcsA [Magnetococcales bacterium]|nr:cytochrome c biogenesis protein CcsA [Magnetococcales bacterium]